MVVTEVPGHILRDLVGTGSTGAVWRGEAVGAPGRIVAIKLVPHEDAGAAVDALHRQREVLSRLSDPGILQILAVVPIDHGFALVTPYVSGGSLAAALAHRSGGLPAAAVADLGARLASALAALHGAGLVHGELRPANVLFDRDGQPLLADIGLAQPRGGFRTVAGAGEEPDPPTSAGGTPDARNDLLALGATLHEALAGVPPDTGASGPRPPTAADRGRFAPSTSHVDAPAALVDAIASTSACDDGSRPAGAHELAVRFAEIRRAIDHADDGPAPRAAASKAAVSGGRAGVLGAVPGSRRPSGPPALGRPSTGKTRPHPATPLVARERGTARRLPRAVLVAVACGVVLLPVGIAIDAATGDGSTEAAGPDPRPTPDSEPDPPGPPAATPSTIAPEGVTARQPAVACDGLRVPDDGRETLLADVAGRGCSAVVAWDGVQLEVLDAEGASERYDLGARPDDVLLFGDWTCDGRDAPALYRPEDGRLFTFDQLVETGGRASATGTSTGVSGGTPGVVTDGDGCDRVEVGR